MEILTLKDILNDKSEPPAQFIGGGIFHKESLLLLTGAKKVRKTFLAYNLGIALASGTSFAGFDITTKNKVLIFSAEGGYYPNRERVQTMCKNIDSTDELKLNLSFDSRLKFENDDNYKEIKELIEDNSPDVLVIDPFVKFHHLDENSSRDMGNILERIRYLIEDYKLSVILVHHLGKDMTHGARGSSAILGEYDSCITLSKEGGEKKMLNKIEFDLRHAISPDSRNLIFNKETFWFEEEVSPIEKLMKKHGSMTRKMLADLLIAQGIPQSTAYNWINKLEERKQLILDTNGEYRLGPIN
jgi:hypothetical protein